MRMYFWKIVVLLMLLVLPTLDGAVMAALTAKQIVTGEVKSLSVKAKVLAIQLDNKEVQLFKYTDITVFKNAKNELDIVTGDTLTVEYQVENDSNLATVITRMIAKMPSGVGVVKTVELEKLVDLGPEKGKYLLIDVRPEAKFKEGHIRTAVSIPYADVATDPTRLLPADKSKLLIFYCDGLTCDLSGLSAEVAVKQGYKNVRVYPEGEPGWKKTEFCTASSVDYIQSGNIVLIDLRHPDKAKKGHIPRAVNIPLAGLADKEKQFPEYKGASIVFYGDSVSDIRSAINTVRDWDYTNASGFTGGIDEWQAKSFPLIKGPAATQIVYVRQLSPDGIGAAEFKKVLAAGIHLIIDSRNKEEFAKGHLAGAINIPVDEFPRHTTELAASRKPIVIYCSTGIRSEMAYEFLKKKKVPAKFVQASIEFNGGDKYLITE